MARIYISSTYTDLKKYREAVNDTLHQLGHEVIAMEYYVATDQRPLDKCLADVDSCDLYVGLFAWRYGFQPPKHNPENKSITELEYLQAKKNGRTATLIFLLDPAFQWPEEQKDTFTGKGNGGALLEQLRNELNLEHMTSLFTTPDNLAKLVSVAVTKELILKPVNPRARQPLLAQGTLDQIASKLARNFTGRYGQIKVLGMTEPIPLDDIYTAVRMASPAYLQDFITPDGLKDAFVAKENRGFAREEAKQDGIEVAKLDGVPSEPGRSSKGGTQKPCQAIWMSCGLYSMALEA